MLTDTGKQVVKETALWFAGQGDKVYIGAKNEPQWMPAGVESILFDPLCEESLCKAADTLKEKEGKLDILVLGTVESSN